MLKKSQSAPFTVFGFVRFFKSNNFCLKIRFSQAQHAISDFCFFFRDRCFFYATFFSNLFSSKPQFLLGTKRFASIKHCSMFSALCDLPETFITLAISKCYGKVRVLFFPRDNSLVSDRKSHNSDYFGLVVRCLLFNPEGPGSNPCLCANFFLQNFQSRRFSLFSTI